ncbi:hypothetical protein WJX81_005510 [Elliptochloris bilobata]|uniref:DUF998 domain-containing protein n=1 Tax=Elliptochloris bilobata TaxID=381761 RepID=A0AAW1RCR2_9CHLO
MKENAMLVGTGPPPFVISFPGPTAGRCAMSVEFLHTFFPHAVAAVERYAPAHLERLFPVWLAGIATGSAALRHTAGFWRGGVGTALMFVVAAAAAAAGFGLPGVPFVHELLYVGSSVAAFWCCLFTLFLRPASTWAKRRWLLVAGLGAALMLGCTWMDPALCAAFGSSINFVHVLFLGCDVVFFAFLQLYRAPAGHASIGQKVA